MHYSDQYAADDICEFCGAEFERSVPEESPQKVVHEVELLPLSKSLLSLSTIL